MEKESAPENQVHHFKNTSKLNKIFIAVLVVALIGGIGSGYVFASNKSGLTQNPVNLLDQTPDSASEDNRTFRDFAEGKITKKPEPKKASDYSEGTHLLVRDSGVPVALTSSVVDLSQYEDKKVKVYGETQKAVKEGWLMDVGRVEVVQ